MIRFYVMAHILLSTGDRLGYRLAEFASLVGISEKHARRMADSGELPTIRLGRAIIVPASAVEMLTGERTAPDGPK